MALWQAGRWWQAGCRHVLRTKNEKTKSVRPFWLFTSSLGASVFFFFYLEKDFTFRFHLKILSRIWRTASVLWAELSPQEPLGNWGSTPLEPVSIWAAFSLSLPTHIDGLRNTPGDRAAFGKRVWGAGLSAESTWSGALSPVGLWSARASCLLSLRGRAFSERSLLCENGLLSCVLTAACSPLLWRECFLSDKVCRPSLSRSSSRFLLRGPQ